MNSGLVTNVKNWLKKPFDSKMSAIDWFLWLGLIIIAAHLWTRVLSAVKE